MREILFRGKRVDNGEWIEGGYYRDDCYGNKAGEKTYIITWNSFGLGFIDHIEVDPSTVGQYTGAVDGNGKMIFEGDVIELINADYEKIRVVCEFGTARRQIFENIVDITGFYFKLPSGKKSFPIVKNYAGKHDLELYEVIGNIHDNPELLESPYES